MNVDISLVLIPVDVNSSSGSIVVGINPPHVHAIVDSNTNSFLSCSSPFELEFITMYPICQSLSIGQLANIPICQFTSLPTE